VILALAVDFEGNLVVGTTDAAGTRLDVRADVLHGSFKNLKRIFYLETVSCLLHTIVNEALSQLFLTI
jgi:hypothetical protein